MIPPSFLAALVAATIYVVGFLLIHRYTAAKWFALEVLFGGCVGIAGLAIGGWLVPRFRFEHFASLYGVLWFCFFFVSGIFYASVSLAIVRYLSRREGMGATVAEVYRDCIVVPFRERVDFLAMIGQAKVAEHSVDEESETRYSISASGRTNAARIRRVQQIFGFGTSGYYSIPNDPASLAPNSAQQITSANRDPHPFLRIVGTVVVAWCLAETCVIHGLRDDMRRSWVGIAAVLILSVACFFFANAAVRHLWSERVHDPARWVLWMPVVSVLLLAQLAGMKFGGTPTIGTDWVVLAATILVFARGLWASPLRVLWPLLVVWLMGVVVWYLVGGTGMIHNELVDRYLPSYLSKRTWLEVLFDPVIEFDDNRSRPLSLIVDFIDYRLVQASALLGFPHFRMVTYPAFMLAGIGTFFVFCVQDLRLRRTPTLLLIMLFQSTPAILFHTLYRSAKIGAALMVIVVFVLLYRYISHAEAGDARRTRVGHLAAIWVACMMLPMFDELGTYSISMGIASLSVYALVRRSKASWAVWATVVSTLAGAYIYRYMVSANLYTWVNHAKLKSPYNVDRALFGKMRYRTLLEAGSDLALDTFRFEFGNMSRGVAAAICLVIVARCCWSFRLGWGSRVDARRIPFVAGIVMLGILAMVVLQFSIMIHFHPPIGSYADVRRVYYALPTIALFLMIVAVTLKTFCAGHRNVSRTVSVFLALAVVGNADAGSDHYKVIHSGHLTEFFQLSDATVARLNDAHRVGNPTDPLVLRVLGQ